MKESKMMEMIREIKRLSYEGVEHLPIEEQIETIIKRSHETAEKLGFTKKGLLKERGPSAPLEMTD